MYRPRVVPCLLLKNRGLVKTVNFKNATYIGDPINAVKIFNDKEVDELVFLDIDASINNTAPDFQLIEDIAGECFMPLTYGGGVRDISTIKRLLRLGVERVVLNTYCHQNLSFLESAFNEFGSSTIIVAVDIKKNIWGRQNIYIKGASEKLNVELLTYIRKLEGLGTGELLVNCVDRDGIMQGYDIKLLKEITDNLSIPVIACGGAGKVEHIKELFQQTDVAAAAAGSLFVYHGRTKGILINYPNRAELSDICQMRLNSSTTP